MGMVVQFRNSLTSTLCTKASDLRAISVVSCMTMLHRQMLKMLFVCFLPYTYAIDKALVYLFHLLLVEYRTRWNAALINAQIISRISNLGILQGSPCYTRAWLDSHSPNISYPSFPCTYLGVEGGKVFQ